MPRDGDGPTEFCGTPAGEERLPVVVRARLARGREGTRSAQHSRQCKIDSDSAVTHQETPSLPSPETVKYCCAIHRRKIALLGGAGDEFKTFLTYAFA